MNNTSHFVLIISLFASACATVNQRAIVEQIDELESEFQHHTGFVLYDPATGETLTDHNGAKYFTPGSNTKIFTLYTALRLLGDSLPGLYYTESEDSLIFWGTGDPTFLYAAMPHNRVYDFLKNSTRPLYFSPSNYYDTHFGPGWAWDDYGYTFSAEKSPLPIAGNRFTVFKTSSSPYLHIDLTYFKSFFWLGDSTTHRNGLVRDYNNNNVIYSPSKSESQFNRSVPFRYSDITTTMLLRDTLHRAVTPIKHPLTTNHKTLYSVPTDSVYQMMMKQSDNFIAEQLLLISAGVISDSLKTEIAIQYAIDSLLQGIPDPPVWKDGSGLSRYNLFTPRSIVWLWTQLYQEIPQDRLFSLLATGGEPGTLANYYLAESPYVYGKTGTLSNNHVLSGFLVTKRGKVFIFSFMNNNYPGPSTPIKRKMEAILQGVHEKY